MTQAIATSRLQETARTLEQVAHAWLDDSADRSESVTALQVSTGFTRPMIEKALTSAFTELTEEKILHYADSEPGFRSPHVPERVLHILAGNVFTSWLPGAVSTLLLGAQCDLKPSSREPVFASLWKHSVAAADPVLGDRIQIVSWSDPLLQNYRAVVAYGNDETLAAIRIRLLPDTRFVAYGHKVSVAVIGKEALGDMAGVVDQLEVDVVPFHLQGCLSPQVVYVEGEDPGIFAGLGTRVSVMPVIKRFESWVDLKAELQMLQPILSTLGYAGSADRRRDLEAQLMDLGLSRVCSVGEMQQPSLSWRNGKLSLVDALTRA